MSSMNRSFGQSEVEKLHYKRYEVSQRHPDMEAAVERLLSKQIKPCIFMAGGVEGLEARLEQCAAHGVGLYPMVTVSEVLHHWELFDRYQKRIRDLQLTNDLPASEAMALVQFAADFNQHLRYRVLLSATEDFYGTVAFAGMIKPATIVVDFYNDMALQLAYRSVCPSVEVVFYPSHGANDEGLMQSVRHMEGRGFMTRIVTENLPSHVY